MLITLRLQCSCGVVMAFWSLTDSAVFKSHYSDYSKYPDVLSAIQQLWSGKVNAVCCRFLDDAMNYSLPIRCVYKDKINHMALWGGA